MFMKGILILLNKWDKRFLNIAREVSTWSKDPSTRVGAVIVRDRRILSCGYNGFPNNVEDDDRLFDKAVKYNFTVHAEVNAISNAARNGIILDNSTMYIHGLPACIECAKSIVQSGISCVIIQSTKETWNDSWKLSQQLFDETDILYYVKGE